MIKSIELGNLKKKEFGGRWFFMTGIKHYTTTTKGIGGRIKRRVSDFIVREITPEGRVLQNRAFGEWDGIKNGALFVPPQEEGREYLHLSMEKFNLDTNDAMRRLCRILYISPKRIGYAGMKDKRGITVQRISLWMPDTGRLAGFSSRYVALSEPEWSAERIDIGKLKGNEFEITVRDIGINEGELEGICKECFRQMKGGVANYFGGQRFGGIREITHRVGKEFIKGNFENAVMMYLTSPSEGEEEEVALARKHLGDTKDFAAASRDFPPKFRYERAIIHHLCKFPRDFVGAFQNLPKHLTYMFTHAYQSYLFNEIINERIEQGVGIGPVEGDVLEDGVPTAALLGFDTRFAGGTAGKIESQILEREGILLSDFKVKGFPELSCRGARKKIALAPHDLKLGGIEKDELNEGKLKLKISFSLDKGNYATTILRELMKGGAG
ncbi:MAG TPA: tRNA pseudouridine(13) synthase TruD [Candidatus Diapherotrites archaeon]|uniref:Probable tRNA pseudouridine synthase D n=1 Tax=Candidatus Iainarchaeum sp. TaxID=3101447 RepID=A0A7J4IY39_9ARCH|nr:tRNA pseudouridine(13) synthase TruD [Candidatus Diapherotrites archaeon]